MLAWSKLIPDYLLQKCPISIWFHRSRFFVDINPDHPLFLKRWRQSIRMTWPWYKTDVLVKYKRHVTFRLLDQKFHIIIWSYWFLLLVPFPMVHKMVLVTNWTNRKWFPCLSTKMRRIGVKIGLGVLGTTNLRSFSTNQFDLSINLVIHCLYFGWGVKPSWTFISSDLWRHS